MRRSRPQLGYINPLEARLEAVEEDLISARHTIIQLVPGQYSSILNSYRDCNSTRDVHTWKHDIVARIVAHASSEIDGHSYYERRTNCPLCRSAGNGPYQNGFTVPVGLERHLTGFGNTHHCPVTEAAFALGRNYAKECFGEGERKAEEEERAERERQLELRRATETLYRTHPYEPPALIDEGYRFSIFGDARTGDAIKWAEERIVALGFSCHTEGNVKSFVLERPEYVVYADLGPAKKITFNVFGKPLARAKKLKRSTCDIPDNYKNDLASKFEYRLKAAVNTLRRR